MSARVATPKRVEKARAAAKERDSELQDLIVFVTKSCLAPFARLRGSMPKSYSGPEYDRWLKSQTDITETVQQRLRQRGATVRYTGSGTEVFIAGIKAVSSWGLQGALLNWRKSATAQRRRR